jgi:hypothetical protein
MVSTQSLHFYYGVGGEWKKKCFSGVKKDYPELYANNRLVPRSKHSPSRIYARQAVYYNVTLRPVRVTIVAVEKQEVSHILSAYI